MEISAGTLQIRLGVIWHNHGIKTKSGSELSTRKKYFRMFFFSAVCQKCVNIVNIVNIVNSVNSVKSVNSVNSVKSVNSVNSL